MTSEPSAIEAKYGGPEWADVTPLLRETIEPQELAAIMYPKDYLVVISYLRAVMAANEMSPRALDLTSDVIKLAPAHYTVWTYRLQTLKVLQDPLKEEIPWLDSLALEQQKNFQIWHHRQNVVDLLDSWEGEADFIQEMMDLDSKNYHVWSYRQWAVGRFRLFDDAREWSDVGKLIDEDVRNNSAWTHRWFLSFGRPDSESTSAIPKLSQPNTGCFANPAVVSRENSYAMAMVDLTPQNESPWNYLRGLYTKASTLLQLPDLTNFARRYTGWDELDTVEAKAEGREPKLVRKHVRSSPALDILAWSLDQSRKPGEEVNKEALTTLDLLEIYDPIRLKYWRYLRATMLARVVKD